MTVSVNICGRGLCPKWVEPSRTSLSPMPNQKPLCLTEDLQWSPVHPPALKWGFATRHPYVHSLPGCLKNVFMYLSL